MRVAEILSDLTSLQVQDSNAALALVTKRTDKATQGDVGASSSQPDTDLRRARELLDLHAQVKVAHQNGMDQELQIARESVQSALQSL
ncbi:hypothetical protein K431DRAFT_283048 [Polychaeton citri CBS 116435]|uniref:Uncharacterized protein n=1 Tax=Polychaeton citri CBS 116435 TaxID=1314669 RepID=A0A9P4Q9S2_9PEZI|nr:hypothetical protein K431DRAFT_283048 [Polychaeton citri CBS 116435]